MTLKEKLQSARIEWPEGGYKYFIPVDIFDELVTKSSVREELLRIYQNENKLSDAELDGYTDLIYPQSKKIFAIVIYGSSGSCSKDLCSFVDEEITDDLLPFSRGCSGVDKKSYSLCTTKHSSCTKVDHISCGIQALLRRSQVIRADFDRDQWVVQAPVFSRTRDGPDVIPHFPLESNVVLPFVEDHQRIPEKVRSGGYSDVWGIRIHPAHQKLLETANPEVILLYLTMITSS